MLSVVIITVIVVIVRAGTSDRRGNEAFDQAGGGLTEIEARDLAFGEAERLGLELVPDAWLARQISFGEYAGLAGERTLSFFGTPDLSPTAIVWVVSMRGELSTPLLGDEAVLFDNLTVVVDAVNGEIVSTASFFEDFESGVRLPSFFTRDLPCRARDLGEFTRIFQSTCPYPVEPEGDSGGDVAGG